MIKFYQDKKEAERCLAQADRMFPGISRVAKDKEIVIASFGANREIFMVSKEMLAMLNKIGEKSRIVMLGDFFGSVVILKSFTPSFSALIEYAKSSERKIIVNQKGEQTFLYGFNLERKFLKSFDSSIKLDEYILICNENDEALGFGIVIADLNTKEQEKKVIKNVLDLGWYLRHKEGMG